ncbi:MAG: DUF4433 domain-containing protein [Bacteroidota bacterium]
MSGIVPKTVWLYRVIHIDNLEHILRNGICTATHPLHDPNYLAIGNSAIINRRKESAIPLAAYGMLGDYIPFYFAGHSPAMYNIITGYEVPLTSQAKLVFLCCKATDITSVCTKWCFTNGPAMIAVSDFYNDLSSLSELDWNAINAVYWKNSPEQPFMQNRKQSEFLVKDFIPASVISSIAVLNNDSYKTVTDITTKTGHTASCGIDTKYKLFYQGFA